MGDGGVATRVRGEMMAERDRSASGAPAAGGTLRDVFTADEVFQRLAATADEEFRRPVRLLWFSGIAAGLSTGASLLGRAALTGALGGADAAGPAGSLLYPVGFVLIVLGRYQLFTENTLTPVTLVLTRIASIPVLLRLWGVVLVANVVGAAMSAWLFARPGLLSPEAAEAAADFAEHALSVPGGALFWKAVAAGGIVASMVWLIHAVRETTARVLIVFGLMLLIPVGDLFHCVVGANEVLHAVFTGEAALGESAAFFGLVALGNTVGGVGLVAVINFAQTRERRFPDRDCRLLQLSWSQWLIGMQTGGPPAGVVAAAPGGRCPPVDGEDHVRGLGGDVVGPPDRGGDRDGLDGDRDGRDGGAPVTVVMYGDYECPYTAGAVRVLDAVASEVAHGDAPMRLVWRHFPQTDVHTSAERAALIAEAAAHQGGDDAFWRVSDALLAGQDGLEGLLGDRGLTRLADRLGLDAAQLADDVDAAAVADRVARDTDGAADAGVRGTPTLFVDGHPYDGEATADAVREVLTAAGRRHRSGTRRTPSATTAAR